MAAVETRFLTFELDRAGVDQKLRTVQLSFSSEAPVDRYFGSEVLDHSTKSVRLDRLNNGGALLLDHDPSRQIGVIETARIDKDRKGRAVVRFGKSALAEEIFTDVTDGIRRLVSVGYRIHKTEMKTESGGKEGVRVTDWEPFEISIVSIPADESVGVGRSAVPPKSPETHTQMIAENTLATPIVETRAEPAAPAAPIQITREPRPVTQEDVARGISQERVRVAEIGAMAAQARTRGIAADDNAAVRNGMSAEEFRTQLYDSLIERQTNYVPGTPSKSEVRDLEKFSLGRGIQAIASNRQLEGIEREMHEEAILEGRSFGLTMAGQFSVPQSVMQHGRRDLTAGALADGGNTIVTTQGSMIELLYSKLCLRGLGTQFLSNVQGNFELPKLMTGTAPAKVAENAAVGESSPTTGVIRFTPKRAGRFVEYSKQLLMQSPIAWESLLRNELTTAIAVMMETACINGGGVLEPLGILATPGIGVVAGGANGLALTRANAIKLKTAVANSNADSGSLGWLTNPLVRGKAQETPIDLGSGLFLWKEDLDDRFMGYNAGVTGCVPSNLVKGTSGAVCSPLIYGNFTDSMFVQWGGIDFTINPYTRDTEGLIKITADVFYDFGIRRAQSFAAISDLLTA